ncbi:MAG TPA: PaaX family transcriptional regulator C-terminal domain-containing protein, partial [Thermoanaerobaculia bacterium]|nr:PaaX family transcriptional regulator C-terminal domain-containing protein [Thermoanaerobaculia bacterium]
CLRQGKCIIPTEDHPVNRDTLREQRWQSDPSERRPAIRSLLLTLLGEFVFPEGVPVWTRSFIRALESLGYAEGAARQALSRSAAAGWLRQERVGRHTRLDLTDDMKLLLRQGSRRIYGFGLAERAWNGEWLLLQVTVPETRRELRHRLHTRLAWAGFGPLGQGVWITPDPSREADALATLEDLALHHGALSFVARSGSIGDPRALVARAWDLDDLSRRYDEFLGRFRGRRPGTPEDSFVVLAELVHTWRVFPFLDPELPEGLYGGGWIGRRAIGRFHELRDRWRPAALRFWRDLQAGAA